MILEGENNWLCKILVMDEVWQQLKNDIEFIIVLIMVDFDKRNGVALYWE